MNTEMEKQTKEACLTTDEFNKPRILEGRDAISTLLVHLILLEPGTYPSRPEMGVGIVSRYRYSDTADIAQLALDIEDQISTFLPEFEGVDIDVSTEKNDNNEILIDIFANGVLYRYETAEQKNNKIGLIDLKV